VKLTSDEFNWLARIAEKEYQKLKAANEADYKAVGEPAVRKALILANKFQQPPLLEGMVMGFSRHQVKTMHVFVKERLLHLMGETIPAYKKRQVADPEKSNHYQEYIDKAKASIAGLSGLLTKLEAEL
jgi:hypothetical protein